MGPDRTALFDLSSDPDEQRDLSGENPEGVARLRAELATLRARFPKEAVGANLELTKDELQEHIEGLRALGYVE